VPVNDEGLAVNAIRHIERPNPITRVPFSLPAKVAGIVLVLIVPAVVWTSVLALVGSMLNIHFSFRLLLFVGLMLVFVLFMILGFLTFSNTDDD